MNVTKKDLVNNIRTKTSMTASDSKQFLENFFETIKKVAFDQDEALKISGFGSFISKITPERIGRNPKSKVSYIIHNRKKLTLSASKKIRIFIN